MDTLVEFFTRNRNRIVGWIRAGAAVGATVAVIVALAAASAHSSRPGQGFAGRSDAFEAGVVEWHPSRSGAVSGYPLLF